MDTPALNLYTTPRESLTLYDLQCMVRGCLESRFQDPVWISAEISELKVNRSGHCYLNLVEKGTTDGAPKAEARAVIWRTAYSTIASKFEEATDSMLKSGLRVLIRVVVSYHEIYGFSLQIIDLDPSYTLGDVERRRRETIARLETDGVWDMNHELEMPRLVLRLAVISSTTAAGYQDFMRELQRNNYRFVVTLFESYMQGDAAEESIINALESIADRESEFDAVAIIRGGGSTSDLALFDSYRIASHVAQFPIPVVTGIGHDKDISVTDMVAHAMCKTPTAVAIFFAELADSEMECLATLAMELLSVVEHRLNDESMRLFRLSNDITRFVTERFHSEFLQLQMNEKAIYNEAERLLQHEEQRIERALGIVESHSVDNILRLGFAILHGNTGTIRSREDVTTGDNIDIELHDIIVRAEVKDIKKKI